jgi:glutaredoxin
MDENTKSYQFLNADNKYMGISVSLRDYVLRMVIQHMKPERLRNTKDNLEKFNRLLKMNKDEYENFARQHIDFDKTVYKYLTDQTARDIVQMKYVKDVILAAYIDHYKLPEVLERELTIAERNELINMLFKAYKSHQFDDSPFHAVIEDIEMSQYMSYVNTNGDTVTKTLKQYVEDSVKNDSMVAADLITNYAYKHREYWINNVPGFVNILASTELDEVSIDEDDVIEKVNLQLLKKIKSKLDVKELNLKDPEEKYVKTVVRVFQELIQEVAGVNMGVGDEKLYLMIDTDNCNIIMETLFPSCKGIYVANTSPPAYLHDFVHGLSKFEDVDVNIFWKYFMRFHTIFGSTKGTVIRSNWRRDETIKKRIKNAALEIYSRRKIPSELSDAQQLRLDIETARKIVLYTKQGCGYCDKAMNTLNDYDLKFTKIEIDKLSDITDSELKDTIVLKNHQTFPIIVIDGKFIGGNYELQTAMSAPQIRPTTGGK